MSLISSIATIATAGAGGSETFWASSVRVRSTVTNGEAPSGFTFHAEHESTGTIMQFMHSNSLASSESNKEAFIIARDPVDGSIIAQKETSQNGASHSFNMFGTPFYNPDMDQVYVSVSNWYDPTSGQSRQGYLGVNEDATNGLTLAFADSDSSNGNGDFFVCYSGNELRTYQYNPNTQSFPNPAGVRRKTNNASARSIWTERGSNDVYISSYYSGGNRLAKTTVGLTSLPNFAAVRELPTNSTSNIVNDFSNYEQCTDSSYLYLWCFNSAPNPDQMELYQVTKSNLATYNALKWIPNTASFSVQHRDYGSICCVDGYVYFSSPIIYRGTGEGYNSVMYAIYQINPSTLQPVAARGIRCDGGAREYIDGQPGMITHNAEETCLYLSFSHAHINSRGADSHKLLKLPLDLSSLPAQTISGGSTHGNIQIWDFLSTSTGATLPVESELFSGLSTSSGSTYSRTHDYESIDTTSAGTEANRTSVTSSLLSDLDTITV